MIHLSGNAESPALEPSTAQELRNLTRGNGPPLGKCRISRAGSVHRSEITLFHALERSITQNSRFLARWRGPSRRNYAFPRAVTVHRSENAESHAVEPSTAQNLCFPARGRVPPLRKCRISRAGIVQHSLQVLLRSFAKRGSDFINLELGFRQYGVDCFDK